MNDIFHEFSAIGADAAPFFLAIDTLIGNFLVAFFGLLNSRFGITEEPLGGEADKQHLIPVKEEDPIYLRTNAVANRALDCPINVFPKLHNVRV